MKKRNSLITVGIVVLILCLLSSISSAVIYDYKNIKIRQVTESGDNFDPEWSPDGSKIVYASTEKGPNSCIWLVDSGGNNRCMISQPESDYEYYEPTWSPDGTKIAFLSHRPGEYYYICVMDSDGSNVTKITPCIHNLNIFNLKWSPDGSKITYDSQSRITSQFCIWVMDPDGNNRIKLTTANDEYNSTWSPDGSKIAYILSIVKRGKQIWIMEPDGSNKVRLMPQKISTFEESFGYYHPTWNPDGTKMAFVANRFSKAYEYFDIVVLNLDDNNVTTLTDTRPLFYKPGGTVKHIVRGDEFYPEWSHDGSKILFTTENDDIWVMNSDGSDKIQLADVEYSGEVVFNLTNPTWSPEGSKILFVRKDKNTLRRHIFVITLSEAIIPATTPSPVATINISVTPTPIQFTPTPATPSPILTPTHSPTPTPRLTPAPTVTPTEFPTPEEKGIPGFEVVFAIAGLLAVAYLLRRRG